MIDVSPEKSKHFKSRIRDKVSVSVTDQRSFSTDGAMMDIGFKGLKFWSKRAYIPV
jgi:hypothetical protein